MYGYHNGPMFNGGGDWGFGLVMGLFWLLVILLVGYFVLKAMHSNAQGAGRMNDPLEIAKSRYAKGEISKEEYEQLKKDLK